MRRARHDSTKHQSTAATFRITTGAKLSCTTEPGLLIHGLAALISSPQAARHRATNNKVSLSSRQLYRRFSKFFLFHLLIVLLSSTTVPCRNFIGYQLPFNGLHRGGIPVQETFFFPFPTEFAVVAFWRLGRLVR